MPNVTISGSFSNTLHIESGSLSISGTQQSVILRDISGDDGINTILQFVQRTAADMVDGFGPRIAFAIADGGTTSSVIARLGAARNGSDDKGDMMFYMGANGTTEAVRINTSGNVGINTTTPEAKLHVASSSAGVGTTCIVLQNRNSDLNTEARLDFITSATDLIDQRTASVSAINTNGVTATALAFKTSAGAAPTEKMRINADGRVGIGTGSPAASASLEISGSNMALLLPRNFGSGSITPTNGMIMYNSQTHALQAYINGGWKNITVS